MLKKAVLATGVVFVLLGILGFIPAFTTNNDTDMPLLLGVFMVGVLHNLIHLGSGVVALAASAREAWARLYFQVFGAVYAVVTLAGFIQGDTVLGLIHVNLADNFLHLFLTVVFLALGFLVPRERAETA